MSKRPPILRVLGTSTEGILIVTGVYRYAETHGVPLDILFERLKEEKMVPSWTSFYQEARAAGMGHDRILSKLEDPLVDVYGPLVRDSVIKGLRRTYTDTR